MAEYLHVPLRVFALLAPDLLLVLLLVLLLETSKDTFQAHSLLGFEAKQERMEQIGGNKHLLISE